MPIRNTLDWIEGFRPKVPTLTCEDLDRKRNATPDLVIVDIRELQERIERGAIPGARHVPRGMLEFWADPGSKYHRAFFTEDANYVIYCAGGARSVLGAMAMMDMGYRNVSHLGPGFDGWAAEGFEIDDIAASSRWVRRQGD